MSATSAPATEQQQTPVMLTIARIVTPIAILALGVGGYFLLKAMKAPPAPKEQETITPAVVTAPLQPHDDVVVIHVTGEVASHRQIDIGARVAGEIVRKSPACEAGNFVRKGDFLLQIDPRDYRLEIKRFEAEKVQAIASRAELKREFQNAQRSLSQAQREVAIQQREYERKKRLSGVISKSELDAAERNVILAENAEVSAQNQLDLIKAREERIESMVVMSQLMLEKATLELDRTEVLAPNDGVIAEEHVEVGAYVNKGSQLIIFEDTTAGEIDVNLRMEQLRWLWRQADAQPGAAMETRYKLPQTPVKVIYRLGETDYMWEGVLTRFNSAGIDPKTRTVPCRVVVTDPTNVVAVDENRKPLLDSSLQAAGPRALLRGMYLDVEIQCRPQGALLRVPERAVKPDGKMYIVRGGMLYVRRVTIAGRKDEQLIVDAGDADIRPADRVVTTVPANIEDAALTSGMKVTEAEPVNTVPSRPSTAEVMGKPKL